MNQIIHIKSITQLLDSYGAEKPKHPLIAIVDLSKVGVSESMSNIKLTTDLYSITLKTKTPLRLKYGRSVIDFAEGSLYGCAPGQVLEVSATASAGEFAGWALYFHPDLIRGHSLANKISNYGFFDYETNEALHLSEQEKDTLNSIIEKIEQECETNIDEFSRDVLVANIELLLNYIRRYYSRQFLTRQSQNTDLLSQFEQLMKAYFDSEQIEMEGLPTVQYFAKALHLSPSYFSDLLKKETGKTAKEHIQLFLIDEAKDILLHPHKSISEVAYELGFEYPQYFSRLFKKKVGMSPSKYITQNILNN